MLKGDGFLGTGASLGADLTLIAEILFFIAIIIAVIAQRRGHYKLHDRIQIPVVLLNLVFITFLMVSSFIEQDVPGTLPKRPGDPYYLVVGIHAGLGLLAEGLAIYCLLAGLKIIPRKIGQLRYFMRATLVAWTVAVLFGVGTYYFWYLDTPPVEGEGLQISDDPNAPQSRRVLLQNFLFLPGDLTVVAGDEITWLNQDGAPHNVTLADGAVASDNFFQGETFSHTFNEPGVYQVFCTLHGNADSGMASTVTVLEATEENIDQIAEAEAQEPPPSIVPPTPTPAPPVPPAPLDLIEPPAPETTVVGILSFHDVLAHSDQVQVSLSGLAAPPAGQEYHAWLVNSSTGRGFDLGAFEVSGDGRANIIYDDPQQQNLMAQYDAFQVTSEPQFDDDPSPGPVVYGGQQPPNATALIRQITVQTENTPSGAGYALAARLQTEEMLRHVQTLTQAYELLSIADSKRHAEHVVNLLDGTSGDHDGVHGAQNPGDGFGIIPYLQTIQDTAVASAAAGDATNAIHIHHEHVTMATDNALLWANEVRQAALEIFQAQSVGDIGPQVERLNQFSTLLLNGQDSNGDGNIAPGEGGLFTAYQHAQYMAAIGIASGQITVVDIQPAAPTPSAGQQGTELVVNMLDFRFEPLNLTVPAGASVRFVNIGQAKHSATASDGGWDTGLFEAGGEATVTFDQPGSYAYFCLLHGTADGNGMAGTVTVEE